MVYTVTANRLKLAMENMGINAATLEQRSGVGKSSISHYVNGTHKPSNITAEQMANVLDVSPLWLMGFDVPEKRTWYKGEPLEYSFRCDYRDKEEYEIAKKLLDTLSQLDREDALEVLHMAEFKLSQEKYKKASMEGGEIG